MTSVPILVTALVILSLATADLPLPDNLLGMNTDDGRRLLLDCLGEGQTTFLDLIRHWDSQRTNTSCGLASVAAILNALRIASAPPDSAFPAEVRYFTEPNLLAQAPVLDPDGPDDIARDGLSLQDLEALIRAASGPYAEVQLHDGFGLSLDLFRSAIVDSMRQANTFVLVNYDRRALGQIGAGHHSPLGAYHSASDRVLILDVAKQKYPPVWVPVSTLFEALLLEQRGYLLIKGDTSSR